MHDNRLDQGLLRGIVVFRWLAWTWAATGVVLSRGHLDHPFTAVALLGLALGVTVAATIASSTRPAWSAAPITVAVELAIGCVLLLADPWVYDATREQSLPWAWPAAAIVTAAVVWGTKVGVAAAAVVAGASFIGERLVADDHRADLSTLSKTALYVLAAVAASGLATRLRDAEREISFARARDELARELHDGVLQTLAVVQRRTNDRALAELARDQERELRDFLFGARRATDSLPVELRAVASRVAARHRFDPSVVLAEDLPELDDARRHALVGAVGEALTNAAKHSGAAKVVLFAEPADGGGVFCSVRDDGRGFDPAATHLGEGVRRSIDQRITEVGGRVEIDARPGRGTEVRMWIG